MSVAPLVRQSRPEAYKLFHNGAIALADVEAAGMRIDMKYLNRTIESMEDRVKDCVSQMKKDPIYKVWKQEFGGRTKISSREQLGHVLFNKLGYKSKEKTKTGRASTNKNALETIDDPFVRRWSEMTGLTHNLSNFLLGPRAAAVRHDRAWWVHPIFNLNIAATYRSSCQQPNLQNVPKRDEEAAKIARRAFLPHPGECIVELDFNVLEVKIAYTYHQDPVMRKYLLDPTKDMHRDCAMDLFMLREDQVDKKSFRHSAKNQFVFAEFYGSVFFQCAKAIWDNCQKHKWKVPGTDLNILEHFAKHGIREGGKFDPEFEPKKGTFEKHVQVVEGKFWKRFSVYDQWKRDWYKAYLKNGYFESHTGFVIHTYHKKNDVINYPIQGAAFHCLLWCIIKLNKWLRKHGMKSKIIGQIHDNLMLSCPPEELKTVIHKAREIMTESLPAAWKWINIPLKVEVEVGGQDQAWSEVFEWEMAA